jgi:hypothetical protein
LDSAWNGCLVMVYKSELSKGKRVSPVRVYVRLWEPIATL